MRRAFVFPGQGSQAVGMGKPLAEAFAAAREVFQEVDDALGQKLSALIWNGPEADLTLTENAQPALMAMSLAVIRVLEREGGLDLARHAAYVAGHSLGEYSALAAIGSFTLADAARLLRTRGSAMQKAVKVGAGAMAALLGPTREDVERLIRECAKGEVLALANDNAPGQLVISGAKAAVDRALTVGKEFGVKKGVPLAVSAPFHSPLMKPAAEAMAQALEAVTIAPPAVPVIANVSALPVSDPTTIRRQLVAQVTEMVRWRETIASLPGLGVETVVEIGAGKVLSGMNKRIAPELKSLSVETPADVEAFLRTL
jgi:[acyl-carrier-protein] S-malonyltransferase